MQPVNQSEGLVNCSPTSICNDNDNDSDPSSCLVPLYDRMSLDRDNLLQGLDLPPSSEPVCNKSTGETETKRSDDGGGKTKRSNDGGRKTKRSNDGLTPLRARPKTGFVKRKYYRPKVEPKRRNFPTYVPKRKTMPYTEALGIDGVEEKMTIMEQEDDDEEEKTQTS
ncbi:unnamed protein product [Microthlaspi erraticum]|uniref:Uncharacterized protein n=1 Tax=Microthlaspi erraticum TaxID=1685480 RepID=A0A6D2KPI1_9BRAS|nr:unnamed protein product [Microthlaspi erraticum]